MHTVIITDRQTTPLFKERERLLFSSFYTERGGSVCHCQWEDEKGNDIEQAVPELYKKIRGYPEWRAIIIVHPQKIEPTEGSEISEDKIKLSFDPRNPFDFKCNRGKGLPIMENPAPLVRLTHMLAGFPSLGVKEYLTGYSSYNEKTGKDRKSVV